MLRDPLGEEPVALGERRRDSRVPSAAFRFVASARARAAGPSTAMRRHRDSPVDSRAPKRAAAAGIAIDQERIQHRGRRRTRRRTGSWNSRNISAIVVEEDDVVVRHVPQRDRRERRPVGRESGVAGAPGSVESGWNCPTIRPFRTQSRLSAPCTWSTTADVGRRRWSGTPPPRPSHMCVRRDGLVRRRSAARIRASIAAASVPSSDVGDLRRGMSARRQETRDEWADRHRRGRSPGWG